MSWTCTKCGMEVSANAASNLVRIGWHITGVDNGLCPPCARRAQSNEGPSALSEMERQIAAQSEAARGRRRSDSL